MKTLDGKVALVTGAGRGIGRAIALRFAQAGCDLVVNDLDPLVLEQTAQDARSLGSDVRCLAGDVTAADFADAFVAAAVAGRDALDFIVNNAGYAWDSVIQKATDEQWQAMLDIHLGAPFRLLRAAQPVISRLAKQELAERGQASRRSVINISSVAGLGGNPGQIGYAAGKAGIVGLTKTLAKEWGRYNVTVNAVAFGAILTRMTKGEAGKATITIKDREIAAGVSDEILGAMEKGIPLGRAGTPEEAAGAVYLFCLPESSYISGEVVTVGGGWSL